jgi:hypothetical protein
MPDSAKSKNEFPVEVSTPGVSLESILCTEELRRRQWRPPDYQKENRALVALLSALLASHSNILQTLAETILNVTQCDSSGVGLLTKDDGGYRWMNFDRALSNNRVCRLLVHTQPQQPC